METKDILSIIFGTGVFSVIITHFLKTFNSDISQERIKWREEIRKLSKAIVSFDKNTKNKAYQLYAELSNRLNPNDQNDNFILYLALKILNLEDQILKNNIGKYFNEEFKRFECFRTSKKLKEAEGNIKYLFTNEISLLLKDDWERCKFESSINNIIPFIEYKSIREISNNDKDNLCFIILLIAGGTIGWLIGLCYNNIKPIYFISIGLIFGVVLACILTNKVYKFSCKPSKWLFFILLVTFIFSQNSKNENGNYKYLVNFIFPAGIKNEK